MLQAMSGPGTPSLPSQSSDGRPQRRLQPRGTSSKGRARIHVPASGPRFLRWNLGATLRYTTGDPLSGPIDDDHLRRSLASLKIMEAEVARMRTDLLLAVQQRAMTNANDEASLPTDSPAPPAALGAALERAWSASRAEDARLTASEAAAVDSELFDDDDLDAIDSEVSSCVVQHPGSLCCTRTRVVRDAANKRAVVSLKTSVRQTGDNELDLSAMLALGAQSLATLAAELSKQEADKAAAFPPDVARTHQQLEEVLQTGAIVHAVPNAHDGAFGHPCYKVRLQPAAGASSSEESTALFKPRIPGDGDGWHRASMEWVAYELNKMLGLDIVPPVAYRQGGCDVAYQHFEEGAFIHFVPELKELRSVRVSEWGVPQERLLSDTRILDVLLHNSDRHHGHFLFGRHWATGLMAPVLIDHAASFRSEAFVSMSHENAFQTGPTTTVSARTYLRLRFLDARAIAARFSRTLAPEEMRALLQRRNAILDYFDALVDERGYNNVVTYE